MPRLNLIRISGNKYDGFKKRHKNSLFSLAPDKKGDHSLFTLQNGSGKGVMIQLISQILLPGTAWGKNKGNKLEGMFYDRYNSFRPYTFHVGLELDLDSDEEDKKLLAAICVSALKKEGTDEDDDKVGLKYFLYTHEYKGDSKFSLRNLPLYDTSEEKALNYDDLWGFLQENKYYFRTFSKNSVRSLNSDYYQYLASHGIYRSEWDIMRTINRSEGGLEKYFSQARDNQELFDKLIIPAVSESINNRDESEEKSLLNIFVNNIKIAKNLPELISRSDDIKRLNNMVDPLIRDAEHGITLEKRKKSIQNRGNNLYRSLENRRIFLENEIKESEKDKEKTEKKIGKLNFKKENLKYARKLRELEKYREKQSKLKKDYKQLEEKIEKLEDKEKKLRLNKIYLPYKEKKNKYNRVKNRIDKLKERLNLSGLREKITSVKKKLKDSWPDLKENVERTSANYYSYHNFLNQRESQLIQREKEIKNNIEHLQRKVVNFEEKEKRLNKWQEKLGERFNYLQLSSPAYIKKELKEKINDKEKRLKKIDKEFKEKENNLEETRKKSHKLKVKLAKLENDYNRKKEEYKERRTEEKEIFAQLKQILSLGKVNESYSFRDKYDKDWISEKSMEAKNEISKKEEKIKSLENENREVEIDLSLNQNNFWIANADQKRLYKKIKALDIDVFYGSDFLLNITDNKDELIKKYPFLIHSLVLMYEGDWRKVKNNLNEEELLRSPVPIFINYEQRNTVSNKDYLKLIHGKELKFIFDSESFKKWYDGLRKKQSEIKNTINTLKNKVKNMNRLSYQSEELITKEMSFKIEMKVEKMADKIKKNKEKISEVNERKEILKNKLDELKKLNKDLKSQIERDKNDLEEINNFEEMKKEIDSEKEKIKKVKKSLDNYKEKLIEISDKQRDNNTLKLKIEHKYNEWKKETKKFLNKLEDFIDEVNFQEKKNNSKLEEEVEFFDYRDSETNYYYQELDDLQKEEEEKNSELKYLRKERNKLRKEILEKEENLSEIDEKWQEYNFTISSLEKVKISLNTVQKNLKITNSKLKNIKSEIDVLKGEINTTSKVIDEVYNEIKEKYNKSPRSLKKVNLDQREFEIDDDLEDSRSYLHKLNKMIEDYKDKLAQLKSLIWKLDSYDLEAEKGEINDLLKEKIRKEPEEVINSWFREYKEIKDKLFNLKEKTEKDFSKFKRNINERVENNKLKSSIKEKILEEFIVDNYNFNYEVLNSFKEYLNHELKKMKDDKEEAEEAKKQWAERSAIHIIRLVNSMKDMISNMVYHNQNGHSFPLVRLKRDDFLPEREEDIIPELEEYFLEVIDDFEEKDINKMTESELEKYTGDAALFSRVIRGQYPKLQVYKMTEKNEFSYARPKDYHYDDWEAVIKGKGDSPEGSGGQSLSINAFMMMMLLNYKKQSLAQSNPWTVMLLDNPFGKASAAHVLDPVFEIANKLNFQIVAFAAPEIVKTEISRRFPVFWALEINDDENGKGVVEGEVIYGERVKRS